MDWQQWADDIHHNAIAHGWWEADRSPSRLISLIRCELAEAIEADRAGEPNLHVVDGKPEGVNTELADALIRLLDWLAQRNAAALIPPHHLPGETSLDWATETIQAALTQAWEASSEMIRTRHLRHAATLTASLIRARGGDVEALISIKHAYNTGRPYKHGKRY